MKKGFEYNASALQAGAIRLGLTPKQINLVDMCILGAIETLSKFRSTDPDLKSDKGEGYFNLNWQLVVTRLPYSGITTRTGVKGRVARLVDCGLIESHPDNIKSGKIPMYRFTMKHEQFHNQFEEDDPTADPITYPTADPITPPYIGKGKDIKGKDVSADASAETSFKEGKLKKGREIIDGGQTEKIKKLVKAHVRKKFKAKNHFDMIPDGSSWEDVVEGFVERFISNDGNVRLGRDGKPTQGTLRGIESWFQTHMVKKKEASVLKPSLSAEEMETLDPYIEMMRRFKWDDTTTYGQKKKILARIDEGMTVYDFQGVISLVHDMDLSFKNPDYVLGRLYDDKLEDIKSFGAQTKMLVEQRLQREALKNAGK